jgi:hypothetical protein
MAISRKAWKPSSFLAANPLITSCTIPSPPTHKMPSYLKSSRSRAISLACPLCVVAITWEYLASSKTSALSMVQPPASRIGFARFSNISSAFPFPDLGLTMILKVFGMSSHVSHLIGENVPLTPKQMKFIHATSFESRSWSWDANAKK